MKEEVLFSLFVRDYDALACFFNKILSFPRTGSE